MIEVTTSAETIPVVNNWHLGEKYRSDCKGIVEFIGYCYVQSKPTHCLRFKKCFGNSAEQIFTTDILGRSDMTNVTANIVEL